MGTESPDAEPENPFEKFDRKFDIENQLKNKMAQQIGKFYATVVQQRVNEQSKSPPVEMKRMKKNELKKMKTKYSAFFDAPMPKGEVATGRRK